MTVKIVLVVETTVPCFVACVEVEIPVCPPQDGTWLYVGQEIQEKQATIHLVSSLGSHILCTLLLPWVSPALFVKGND